MRYANRLSEPVERLVLDSKREKPYWGARKIRELLVRRLTGALPDRLTHHVHILEMNGESFRPRDGKSKKKSRSA